MNILQEKNKSLHVFTPPATSEKPRDNFVSRDNFGHYCYSFTVLQRGINKLVLFDFLLI